MPRGISKPMNSIDRAIAKGIYETRTKLGISGRELAHQLGVSAQ